MSGTLPTVITSAGLQPQSPASLRAQLLALVSATNPGYTANLPGSLVEDIASTDVAAIALCDSARVELVNSLTPFGANAFLLNQLGQIYGVPQGLGSTTSVNVVFSGPVDFVIAQGFTVSDGQFQYIAQDGGVIGAGGTSLPIFMLAALQGSWVVPAGTVTNLVTSVPLTITNLTVTNPLAGTPGTGPQSEEEYRAQVLQAGLAISQGMTTKLKKDLRNVPGVQARLVSTRQVAGGFWEIIVGGGDPYQVANAIFTALFDISTLVGSTLAVTGITNANPGVVTLNLNHNYVTGQVINISGVVGMTAVNNTPLTATVTGPKTFSIGVDTTGFGAYVSGGVVTPNPRNSGATINDYPDSYFIPFVLPPQQTVTMSVLWNTTATNLVSQNSVVQLANPALVAYVNQLPVGVPINQFELIDTFQQAVASIIPPQLLTRLVFSVSIGGVGVAPAAGTGIIAGDPESYFLTSSTGITIAQG